MLAIVLSVVLGSFLFLRLRQESIHASRMAQCNSNHASIVAAISQFYEQEGRFPADILAPDGTPLLSWRVELLSILAPIRYARFDLNQPWNSQKNGSVMHPTPHWYHCPGEKIHDVSHNASYYFVRYGEGQPGRTDNAKSTKTTDDEAMSCIAIVEAEGLKIPWSCPGDLEGDPCRLRLLNPEKATTACRRPETPFGVKLNGERVVLDRRGEKVSGR